MFSLLKAWVLSFITPGMRSDAINSLFVGDWESVLFDELPEHNPTAFLKD